MPQPISAPLVLLDVNETLLDLSGLDGLFEQTFGSAEWKTAWTEATLALALKNTDEAHYHDFAFTGKQALVTLAAERGREVPADFSEKLAAATEKLPLHPDVKEGIERLHSGGFRVAVLTNSQLPVVTVQLRNAGIFNVLDAVLSADNARQLKPGQRAYEYALHETGAEAASTWMVAVHVWDIKGAMTAGMRGAYLSRKSPWPEGEQLNPQVKAATLLEAAEAMLRQEPVPS